MFSIFKRKIPELNIVDETILNVIQKITSSDIKTIVDVGAHYGRYALATTKFWPSAFVYCFEPFPEVYKDLVQNLKHVNCKVYNSAVAQKSGINNFYVNTNSETNSLLKSIPTLSSVDTETVNLSTINVDVTTLDDFFKKEALDSIDLLKIDVQGSTLPVLQGSSYLLKNKKIKILQCEVEFIRIYENEKLFYNICEFLDEFEYELYSLYNLHYDINERLSWADALFTLKG